MHPESLVQGRSLEWAAEECLSPENPQKNISSPQRATFSVEKSQN